MISRNGRFVAFVSTASIDDGVEGRACPAAATRPAPTSTTPRQARDQGQERHARSTSTSTTATPTATACSTTRRSRRAAGQAPACGVSTDLVSVDAGDSKARSRPTGAPAESGCRVSNNGRYVVFATAAKFHDGDTNNKVDVYLRDRDTDNDGQLDESGRVDTHWIGKAAASPWTANGDRAATPSQQRRRHARRVRVDGDEPPGGRRRQRRRLRHLPAQRPPTGRSPASPDDAGAATAPSLSADGTRVAYQVGTGATATVNVELIATGQILRTVDRHEARALGRRHCRRVRRRPATCTSPTSRAARPS